LDSAPQSAELNALAISSGSEEQEPKLNGIQESGLCLKELSGLLIDELWREADADSVGLGKDELATVLLSLGDKYNYGLTPGTTATRAQIGAFWRTLQLQDCIGRNLIDGSII
jgi:hypothetical protein